MLANIIIDIIPQAIGVALSTPPVIAVILLLFGTNGRRNGLAFLFGWMAGLAAVGGLALVLANAGRIDAGGEPLMFANSTLLLLGLLLLYLGYRSWKQRSKPRADSETPDWMSAIDSFSPRGSFGLGAMLAIANPKNLTLTLSAALIIAQSGLSNSQTSIALAAFVAISSLTILVPVAYFLFAKTSADNILAGWKSWLVLNNSTIQIYLYLIFGALMAFIGLRGIINEMHF